MSATVQLLTSYIIILIVRHQTMGADNHHCTRLTPTPTYDPSNVTTKLAVDCHLADAELICHGIGQNKREKVICTNSSLPEGSTVMTCNADSCNMTHYCSHNMGRTDLDNKFVASYRTSLVNLRVVCANKTQVIEGYGSLGQTVGCKWIRAGSVPEQLELPKCVAACQLSMRPSLYNSSQCIERFHERRPSFRCQASELRHQACADAATCFMAETPTNSVLYLDCATGQQMKCPWVVTEPVEAVANTCFSCSQTCGVPEKLMSSDAMAPYLVVIGVVLMIGTMGLMILIWKNSTNNRVADTDDAIDSWQYNKMKNMAKKKQKNKTRRFEHDRMLYRSKTDPYLDLDATRDYKSCSVLKTMSENTKQDRLCQLRPSRSVR